MTRAIEGSLVHPTNRTYQHQGSIHDDVTAQALGFRGGTVAAATHLDVFVPLLVAAFGERWFEDGCLSLYFRHATTDGEPVRARIELSDDNDDDAIATLLTPDDTVVAEGTASVGFDCSPPALAIRDLRHEPTGLRILAGIDIGAVIGPEVSRCGSQDQSERIHEGLVASPLDWYRGGSPWGPPVAAPSTAIEMFTQVAAHFIAAHTATAVALWGAMELRFHGTPLVCDEDLTIDGAVIALGSTPKTETLWYDLAAHNGHGRLVATTRVLTRFTKASSPLYETG